jgi:hypothetical protein
VFAALDRAKPALLDALSVHGIGRIEYVVGFVEPYSVWVWLGTETDAQRDALPGDRPLLDRVRDALEVAGLPLDQAHCEGVTVQSQETVDRDYDGSWFSALR